MLQSRCIVIGAGSVGVNLALFLDAWGFRVDLIEAEDDILKGAAQASFINHGDGLEYFKPGHKRTGEYCIQGSLTKALIYPLSELSTGVCSEANPIRFSVAQGAVNTGRITQKGFLNNARHMTEHYRKMFHAIQKSSGMTDEVAREIFLRVPQDKMKPLKHSELSDICGVVTGVHGNGFGINMPHYYSLVKQALRKSGVKCHFGVKVGRITKLENGDYEVQSRNKKWRAHQILVSSSHHIPNLVEKIRDAAITNSFAGTYYLNSMTFLRLPKTKDAEKRRLANHINFTLMEKHGCMYACIVPPTEKTDGTAAIYYPDPTGSQLQRHVCLHGEEQKPPSEWDHLVRKGLQKRNKNVTTTFKQACKLYPFLSNYAKVTRTICRTVFNIDVKGSDHGLDRRVREISEGRHTLTEDGQITGWTAPKWTNAELTALMALDYVLAKAGRTPLPRDKKSGSGCGPTKLDVAKISERISFRKYRVDAELARTYARDAKLPERMVRRGARA